LDEKAFAELFDSRQPVGRQAQRCPVHCEPDVLEVAIRGGRRGLEAGEAVEARNLAQAMHDDKLADRPETGIIVRIPEAPHKGFGVKQRARHVVANRRLTACEDVEFRELWRQRRVLVMATPQLLESSKDILVGVPFERCSQRRIEASRLRNVGWALRRIEIAEMTLHQRRQCILGTGQ
jgi:hypothetical protein